MEERLRLRSKRPDGWKGVAQGAHLRLSEEPEDHERKLSHEHRILDCNVGKQNQIPLLHINQCHINALKGLLAITEVESYSKGFWHRGLDQKKLSETRGVRSSSSTTSSSSHNLWRVAFAPGDPCKLKMKSHSLLQLIFASTALQWKKFTMRNSTWTKSKSK